MKFFDDAMRYDTESKVSRSFASETQHRDVYFFRVPLFLELDERVHVGMAVFEGIKERTYFVVAVFAVGQKEGLGLKPLFRASQIELELKLGDVEIHGVGRPGIPVRRESTFGRFPRRQLLPNKRFACSIHPSFLFGLDRV